MTAAQPLADKRLLLAEAYANAFAPAYRCPASYGSAYSDGYIDAAKYLASPSAYSARLAKLTKMAEAYN